MQTFPLGAQTAWPIRICLSLPSSLQVPRAMSLFLSVAHGLRWILGLATLCILQRRGLYPGLTGGEDRVSGSHPPSQVPMLASPLHALTGGRQVALFGVSCSPLPLTLLGRKGECQSLGAEVLETLSGELRRPVNPSAKFGDSQPMVFKSWPGSPVGTSHSRRGPN